jgi:hypothetical protein
VNGLGVFLGPEAYGRSSSDLDAATYYVDRLLDNWESDPEVSHSSRDAFWAAVLEAITEDDPWRIGLAQQALRLSDARLTAWMA